MIDFPLTVLPDNVWVPVSSTTSSPLALSLSAIFREHGSVEEHVEPEPVGEANSDREAGWAHSVAKKRVNKMQDGGGNHEV